jgi:hypothetical protein
VSNDQSLSAAEKAAKLQAINDRKDAVAKLVDEKARRR